MKRHFIKYSKLISVLLTAKKTNELQLKNHDLRPIESTVVPEAHTSSNRSFGHSKGRGANKVEVFSRVAVAPAHRIEITPENKIIAL